MNDSIKAILFIPLPTLLALAVLDYFYRKNNPRK